jgi:hypothetical protein
MLIELSDDQIEVILDQIYSAMDEYGDDDKSILLCRYLCQKYHIEDAKYGAEKKTSDEWQVIHNKEQEEKARIYLQEQQKLFEAEKSRINATQTLLGKAPVYINEKTGEIMKGMLDKNGNVIGYYQLDNKELNQNSS